jgi:endonuclease/exonuclease/phosphatase family metal-dependent hydrolase
MLRYLLFSTILLTTLGFSTNTQADCRGCCSHHGGVICKDGITECADGSPLSQTCQDKGCSVCPECSYTISPESEPAYYPASGGNGTIEITTDVDCSWTLSTEGEWLSIDPSHLEGSGNGSIPYSVGINPTFEVRSSDIVLTAGGIEQGLVTVTQEAKTPKIGDLNLNDKLGLTDAVGCLQIVAGLRTTTLFPNLSLSDAISILKVLSGIPSAPKQLTIASFNIQTFGTTKASNAEVMGILADIISRHDIVAIQEIRDSSGEAIEDLEAKVDALGEDYEYIIGPRVGRSVYYKEQYAFMYRTAILAPGDSFTFDDSANDVFEREPYIARFETMDGGFDFVLINIHTDPDFATQEIGSLTLAVDSATQHFPDEPDVFVLGDFNADCAYFDETGASLLVSPEFDWIITNDIDTNVASTVCTYDRIVLLGESEVVVTDAGAFNFSLEYELPYEQAQDVSDHYPVFVRVVY